MPIDWKALNDTGGYIVWKKWEMDRCCKTIQLKVGVSGVYILVSDKACKAETKYYEIDV